MNKKGQSQIGLIVMIAVTIIIGAIFLQTIAQSVGESVNTITLENQTETLAANGESIYVDEWKAIHSPIITNATGFVITSGNYTVTNDVIDPTTGGLSTKITTDDAAYASTAVLVSGTAEPLTYISDSGSRAMTNLIVIMFALAVLVAIIGPSVSKEFLASLTGR